MKIALLLPIVCGAAILSGCSSMTHNAGGTSEQNEYSTGSSMQTGPAISDPSLPQDPNAGPAIPPP